MSRIDPECFPESALDGRPVCARCFGDRDLSGLIRGRGGPAGCAFCGRDDAPTMPFDDVMTRIASVIGSNYGRAVDELPYDGAEGGYQAWHADTYDLIRDEIGLELPRDESDELFRAITDALGDEMWCEFDWLVLEPDESLGYSWQSFCETVKFERRFFFHDLHGNDGVDPDGRSPTQFLTAVCKLVERQGLIRAEPAGYPLHRARPRGTEAEKHATPASLGPPPPSVIQSNRMNPPGIPMFYGSDRAGLAAAETRSSLVSVGRFETTRSTRLLDLADLPDVPGFFSDASRIDRLTLGFLKRFADLILQPVPRDDRVHLDYVPTQIFTEFLRDFGFEGGPIDGLRYRSATGEEGKNVVLFAGPGDVDGVATRSPYASPAPLLRLVDVRHLG